MKLYLLPLSFLVMAAGLQAQTNYSSFQDTPTNKTGSCSDGGTIWRNSTTGQLTSCQNGHYALIGVTLVTNPIVTVVPTTLTITLSEDAMNSVDALVSVSIDDVILDASRAVTTARCGDFGKANTCTGQNFVYSGMWDINGPHKVVVTFLNDQWTATAPGTDRNAYVNGAQFGSIIYPNAVASLQNTGQTFTFNVGTAAPAPGLAIPPTGAPPPNTDPPPPPPPLTPVSSLTITMTEDKWQVDALVNITVDGQILASNQSITTTRCGDYGIANTCAGQDFTYQGTLASTGPHTIGVTFLNDVDYTSPTQDVNAYVNGITFNGVYYPNAIAALQRTGDTFNFQVGTAATAPGAAVLPTPPSGPATQTAAETIPKATIPTIPGGAVHVASGSTSAFLTAIGTASSFVVLDGGTYNLTTWPSVAAGVTIMGTNSAKIHSTLQAAITLNSNCKVYNIVFDGAGIWLNNDVVSVTIAGNTFQNINTGNDAIHEDNYLGASFVLDSNYFYNISKAGYPNGNPQWEGPASGFFSKGFGDNAKLTNNVCDGIEYDCLKGFHNQAVRNQNFLVAGNVAHHVHRIGFEFQDCNSNVNNCFSGTGGSTNNAVYKDNFFDHPWQGDKGMFAFSFPVDHSTNMQIINNSGVAAEPCCYSGGGWYGYGIEISGDGTLIQGNAILSTTLSANGQAAGWGCPLCFDNSSASTAQMNHLCGANSKIVQGGKQANGVIFPSNNIDRYNVKNTGACPVVDSTLSNSSMTLAATKSGLVVSAVVVSIQAIRSVQFFADNATTPFLIQEIQDINTNFSADRKWLYHATAPNGTSKVTVIVVDVLKTTQSVTVTL